MSRLVIRADAARHIDPAMSNLKGLLGFYSFCEREEVGDGNQQDEQDAD
ncbi:MAG: hypothetical protein QXW60_02380 [Nitrososphaerota archaeon]